MLRDGHLYAYAWVYVIGEMCLFSTILGHGEHMRSGIMALLVAESVHDLMASADLRYAMYNLHASGTDGLRFFKEQMGFAPYRVSWVMGDGTDAERLAERAGSIEAAEAALRAAGQRSSPAGSAAFGNRALGRLARRVGRLVSRG